MRRSVCLAVLFCLIPLQPVFAVQAAFQTAKLVRVERKTRSRVLYYIVNTPVTAEDPYFEIAVQLNNTIYLCEYEPQHSEDALPDDWRPNGSVLVKIEKRHMILKSPGNHEYVTVITKRGPAIKGSQTTTQEKTP